MCLPWIRLQRPCSVYACLMRWQIQFQANNIFVTIEEKKNKLRKALKQPLHFPDLPASPSTQYLPLGAHSLPSPLPTVTFSPSLCSGGATVNKMRPSGLTFSYDSLCTLLVWFWPHALWTVAPTHYEQRLENGKNQDSFRDRHADLT